MKIKRNKQLNLPQLMEWAWENDVRNKNLLADNNVTPLRISIGGEFIFDNDYIYSKNHTFTVTAEEEITEDTKLDLIERFIGGMGSVCYTSHTMSIKECLKRGPSDCTTTHFYIENDDRELILIWRDGKLI